MKGNIAFWQNHLVSLIFWFVHILHYLVGTLQYSTVECAISSCQLVCSGGCLPGALHGNVTVICSQEGSQRWCRWLQYAGVTSFSLPPPNNWSFWYTLYIKGKVVCTVKVGFLEEQTGYQLLKTNGVTSNWNWEAIRPLCIPHLLAAFCTCVRALSSMCSHVYLEVVLLWEMFPTLSTAKGSFTCQTFVI
jgi:hypothetical protein